MWSAGRVQGGKDPICVQPTHLKGYWKLNGGSPELDSSGNGNSGTVTGTTTPASVPTITGCSTGVPRHH